MHPTLQFQWNFEGVKYKYFRDLGLFRSKFNIFGVLFPWGPFLWKYLQIKILMTRVKVQKSKSCNGKWKVYKLNPLTNSLTTTNVHSKSWMKVLVIAWQVLEQVNNRHHPLITPFTLSSPLTPHPLLLRSRVQLFTPIYLSYQSIRGFLILEAKLAMAIDGG